MIECCFQKFTQYHPTKLYMAGMLLTLDILYVYVSQGLHKNAINFHSKQIFGFV